VKVRCLVAWLPGCMVKRLHGVNQLPLILYTPKGLPRRTLGERSVRSAMLNRSALSLHEHGRVGSRSSGERVGVRGNRRYSSPTCRTIARPAEPRRID